MANVQLNLEIKTNGKGELTAVVTGLDKTAVAAKGAKAAVDPLAAGMSDLGKMAGQMTASLGPVGAVLTALGPVGIAAGAGVIFLGTAISSLLDKADVLANLSAQTGMSTTALQEFAHVGGQVGASQEGMALAIGKASRLIEEGGAKAEGALAKLGLNIDRLAKMSPEDQFRTIAAELKNVSDAGERASISMALFGKNPEVLRVLRADLEGLSAEAQRFGLILSEEAVAKLDAAGDAAATAGEALRSMKDTVALAAFEALGGAAGFREMADSIGSLSGSVREHLPQVTALFEAWSLVFKLPWAVLYLGKAALDDLDHATIGAADSAQHLTEVEMAAVAALAGIHQKSLDAAQAKRDEKKAYEEMRVAGEAVLKLYEKEDRADRAKAAIAQAKAIEDLAAEIVATTHALSEFNAQQDHLLENMMRSGAGDRSNLLNPASIGLMPPVEHGSGIVPVTFVPQLSAAEKAARDAAEANRIWVASMEEAETRLRGVGSILGAVGGLFTALGVSAESAAGRTVAAAAGIANAAAGMAGALSTANPFDDIAAGIGLATSIISGVASVFGSPSWEQVGIDAGHQLGIAIGDEMAQQIEETAETLNLSTQMAALLNISAAAEAAHADIRTMDDDIVNLVFAIRDGAVPAAEGIEELDRAWQGVRDSAEAAHVVGDQATIAIIRAAQETGQLTAGMQTFLDGLQDRAISGAELIMQGYERVAASGTRAAAAGTELTANQQRFFDAAKANQDPAAYDALRRQLEAAGKTAAEVAAIIDTKMGNALDRLQERLLLNQGSDGGGLAAMGDQWGIDAAQSFVFGFEAEMNKNGIVATLDEKGDQLQAFYQQLVDSGNTAGAALLAPFAQLDNQLTDSLRGVLEVNTGMGQVFTSIADQGLLMAADFEAMQRNILATDEALRAAGVNDNARIAATRASLVDLASAGQQYNLTLSDQAQALAAEGGALPVSEIMQVVDQLKIMNEGFGFLARTLVGDVAPAFDKFGTEGTDSVQKVGDVTDSVGGQVQKFGGDATASLLDVTTGANDVTKSIDDMGQTVTDQGDAMYIALALAGGALVKIAENAPLAGQALDDIGDEGTASVSDTTEGTDALGKSLSTAATDAERLLAALLGMPAGYAAPGAPAAPLGPLDGGIDFVVPGPRGRPYPVTATLHGQERMVVQTADAVQGGGGRGGPVTIIVQGARDPEATARVVAAHVKRIDRDDQAGARTSRAKQRR